MKYINKYKAIPLGAKASMWYALCNILQKGISFIVIPIYTRVLTTTEYGEYSVFNSWLNILIIFATLNLYCGVFTKALVDYENDRDRYTSSMQGLSTMLTFVMFVVYICGKKFWNMALDMNTETMILMFAYFIFYPAMTFWSVRQRVEYKYISMVAVTLLTSVVTPAFSLILLFCTSLRANAVIWGYLIIQSSVGAFFYVHNFVRGKVFFVKKYWLEGLKFNVPLVPHYLSLIVLGQADRIMIGKYCGTDKTAVYNLAYQVSMMMSIFITAINNSLVPWTYESLRKKEYGTLRKVCNGLCFGIAVLTVGAVLISPEIVKIMGNQEYTEAIWVIPAVSISVYFTFCYGLFSNVEFYFGATQYVMIASTTGAILNIILNAVFIPAYGYIIAGYTTLFCYFVFMIMHYLFMRNICKKKICGEHVFDIKFISISCIIIVMVGALCMFLYGHPIVRYAVVVLGVMVGFLARTKIIKIVNQIRKK